MKKLTPRERAELVRRPLPVVRYHGQSTSRGGCAIRRRGAKPQPLAAKYFKEQRPRPKRDEPATTGGE